VTVFYQLEWKRSATKDLRRIATSEVPRIVEAAEALTTNPFPPGCVKLTGSERSYRIRVGEYRILYEVFSHRLVIEVIRLGHRQDVYKG
jgi:mRNA interferase RelE/StbE